MSSCAWSRLALVAVVVARAVGRVDDVLRIVVLAATAALLTAPLTRLLARRLPRGASAAITALVTFVAVLALVGVVFRFASVHVSELAQAITDRIEAFQPGSLPERVSRSLELPKAIDDTLSRLPAAVLTGEEDPLGAARRSIDVLLIVILAAFFQASAPNFVDGLVKLRPRSERGRLRAFAADVERRAGRHTRQGLALAAVVWIATTGVTMALGVPGGVVLGAWAGAWSLVPWVGGWVGMAPLVALAFTDGRPQGVLAIVAGLAIALAAGQVRRMWVERHSFVLGPALGVLALAAGSRLAGPPGALMAFTAVCVLMAAATSEHRPVLAGSDGTANADGPEAVKLEPPEQRRQPLLGALATAHEGVIRVVPGWRGALTVLAGVALGALVWMLVATSGRVITWLIIAALVAVAVDRPVAALQRRARVPRPVAIGAACAVGAIVLAGVVTLGASGGAATSSQVQKELPQAIADLEDAPVIGPWLREHDASVWVSQQLENLPQRLSEVRVAEWLPTVGERVLDLGWTMLLAMALLIDGPRLAAAMHRRVPARRRRQTARLTHASHAAIAGYLAGAAPVAGINATVVLAIALVLGIALAPVLAVWAFVWNFVPQIGGFMGGFPLVVLALAKGPAAAVAAGALFVTYQFVENHLIQPAIISEAIDVPAWAALLAALVGGAVGGVVGAVVLTPLVGVVKVLVDELRRDDFPGTTVPLKPAASEKGSTADSPAVQRALP